MSTTTFTAGKLKFELSLGSAPKAAPRDPDAPLHILIMADFCGESRLAQAARKPFRIDLDNFDQVMTVLEPRCRVLLRPMTADLSFSTLDDFHPDRILRKIEPAIESLPALKAAEDNQDLLARLMGDPPPPQPAPAPSSASKPDISALIRNAVGSDAILPNAAEQAARAQSEIYQTNGLRTVLHDPAFQSLEANWRGVDLLVRTFGAEDQIALSIVDCDFARFLAEINSGDDAQATTLFQLLRKRNSDERFAVILALYTFEPAPPHIDALMRAMKICAAQQAILISAASPAFVGSTSFSTSVECAALPSETEGLWNKVRALPEAHRLALAMPRFLLRQPYGAASDAIESFPFEELTPDLPHEHYLWGNSAILCGHVLAEAFLAEGWDASTAGFAEVGDLPFHRFKHHGETRVKPCAETWLPDPISEQLTDRGFIPIQTIKGRDAVRLAVRSISCAGGPLPLK
jgi:type VI secretion system protein ImpC